MTIVTCQLCGEHLRHHGGDEKACPVGEKLDGAYFFFHQTNCFTPKPPEAKEAAPSGEDERLAEDALRDMFAPIGSGIITTASFHEAFKRGLRKGRAMERAELTEHIQAERMYTDSWKKDAERLRAELVEIRHAYNFDMKRRDENDERREEEHTQTLINQQNNHQRQMGQLREKLSESKRECEEAKAQAGDWERVAKEWMRDYDRLKEKYEPMIAVTSEVSAARAEAARLRAALEKLTACCEDEAAFGVREVHPLVVEARAALRGSEEKGTEGEK